MASTRRGSGWTWCATPTASGHDHKTEPLAQTDFYRFRAFFEGVTFRDDLSLALAPDQEPLKGLLVTDSEKAPEATHLLSGGDLNQPREEMVCGVPAVLDPNPVTLAKPAREKSTGRRLTLARWITAKDNPLAARVLVNRIWMQHFGEGLVATPNDFGYSGSVLRTLPCWTFWRGTFWRAVGRSRSSIS